MAMKPQRAHHNVPTKLISALLFLFALNAPAITRYVDLNNPSPAPPV
jgi:hypothetical protein